MRILYEYIQCAKDFYKSSNKMFPLLVEIDATHFEDKYVHTCDLHCELFQNLQ